ncbi:hypothetical protein P152DRAFT_435296 [Eremomyces bilateralis CBS 781.70]|uniref:Peroxisomal membrane protein PEX14 n=1 Tax=Eremomyces bilateralis CBS 781.70 TaxID=1392243 RepID=A0A6G1G4N6_9PEZI|nr:uncharacterized protein P152DRAFT_435296 [Eremomyces bilateralis CBS 781.70]KAF1812962.1 hypothetical protein P152DRAFT_435296 [Eremomyces bilateralis CBS 781.70]
MVREDLVNSAVTFLQDPSVANAPIEKKLAFLESKNLTKDEVDVALARSGSGPAPAGAVATAPPTGYNYRQPPQGYGYPPTWPQQQPPPEVPRRDWRDWFIMATVVGGVSYGLYFTAKRYLVPLIKPPTPPQVEQDKAAIDEQFARAFALLDQLATDTASLKSSEEARTNRLDSALDNLDSVIKELTEADRRRNDDARRTADEIRGLRDQLPRAMDAQKESADGRLRELGQELKSLKTLIGNRMGSAQAAPGHQRPLSGVTPAVYGVQGPVDGAANTASPTITPAVTPTATPTAATPTAATNGSASVTGEAQATGSSSSNVADRAQTQSPYGRFGTNGKAAIPAWQMAASKPSPAVNGEKKEQDTSESGTVTEAAVGA